MLDGHLLKWRFCAESPVGSISFCHQFVLEHSSKFSPPTLVTENFLGVAIFRGEGFFLLFVFCFAFVVCLKWHIPVRFVHYKDRIPRQSTFWTSWLVPSFQRHWVCWFAHLGAVAAVQVNVVITAAGSNTIASPTSISIPEPTILLNELIQPATLLVFWRYLHNSPLSEFHLLWELT